MSDLHSISGSDDLLRNADVGHMLELREKMGASDLELSRLREDVARLVGALQSSTKEGYEELSRFVAARPECSGRGPSND